MTYNIATDYFGRPWDGRIDSQSQRLRWFGTERGCLRETLEWSSKNKLSFENRKLVEDDLKVIYDLTYLCGVHKVPRDLQELGFRKFLNEHTEIQEIQLDSFALFFDERINYPDRRKKKNGAYMVQRGLEIAFVEKVQSEIRKETLENPEIRIGIKKWWYRIRREVAEATRIATKNALGEAPYSPFKKQPLPEKKVEVAPKEDVKKLAEQGNTEAQYKFGMMCETGDDVTKNLVEASKWHAKAAEKGHSGAQYSIGFMREMGRGIQQNYREAIKWYTKASEQGNPRAQYCLAMIYKKGEYVHANYEEAFRLFTKSAKQGNQEAQYNLDLMRHNGEGQPCPHKDSSEKTNLKDGILEKGKGRTKKIEGNATPNTDDTQEKGGSTKVVHNNNFREDNKSNSVLDMIKNESGTYVFASSRDVKKSLKVITRTTKSKGKRTKKNLIKVDSAGILWHPRFHSENKTKNQDLQFRKKRNYSRKEFNEYKNSRNLGKYFPGQQDQVKKVIEAFRREHSEQISFLSKAS